MERDKGQLRKTWWDCVMEDKFDGGLLRLREADEAAVDWLTTYGS